MRKIVLVAAVMAVFTSSHAQQTIFGVKAGVNFNSVSLKGDGQSLSGSNTGFHVGVLAHIAVTDAFAIQPNILFSERGGSISIPGQTADFKFDVIEVPINLLYTNQGFFVGAGPSFNYGLNGKLSESGVSVDLYDKDNSSGVVYKRMELGINAIAGYRLPNGLFFGAHYNAGLNNVYNGDEAGVASHTSAFGLSVGYLFGGSGKEAAKQSGKASGKSRKTWHGKK